MIKIAQRTYINIPSEFKLVLTELTDKDGNVIDFGVVRLIFDFKDAINNSFIAVYDPVTETYEHTSYDENTGELTIFFDEYNLKPGQLSCQIGTITNDGEFSDSKWNFYTSREQINIVLI